MTEYLSFADFAYVTERDIKDVQHGSRSYYCDRFTGEVICFVADEELPNE